MMVRGGGQVLFGKTQWTAAVAEDLMGDKGKIQIFIKIIFFFFFYSVQSECFMIHTRTTTLCCLCI